MRTKLTLSSHDFDNEDFIHKKASFKPNEPRHEITNNVAF